MSDIVELKNWLTADEINAIKQIVSTWPVKNYWARHGRFEGELVAGQSYHQWTKGDALEQILGERMDKMHGPHRVVETLYQELYFPWDVHTDWENVDSITPHRVFVIPLGSYDSRTIIFNQYGNYRDFYKHKQQFGPVENCVDLEFWHNNLSHCWEEDRQHLSLKYVSKHWRPGDVLSFPRNIFHSSDDFYLHQSGPKRFLQILTDCV
jgi:hypothetical protein